MCPVWMDGPNGVMFMGGVSNRLIQTNAVLPDTGQPYPSELWNAHLGLMYHRQLDNGWMAGGGINLGSASDRPFGALSRYEHRNERHAQGAARRAQRLDVLPDVLADE